MRTTSHGQQAQSLGGSLGVSQSCLDLGLGTLLGGHPFGAGVGPGDLQRSLPTAAIPWLRNSGVPTDSQRRVEQTSTFSWTPSQYFITSHTVATLSAQAPTEPASWLASKIHIIRGIFYIDVKLHINFSAQEGKKILLWNSDSLPKTISIGSMHV